MLCDTYKNVPLHNITRKNSRTNKNQKWFIHIKSIFIKLQKNTLLTKNVLAHIIMYFIKMVFYHIISWKISEKHDYYNMCLNHY